MKMEKEKIKNILHCSDQHAAVILTKMAPYVDFSEITVEAFHHEVMLTDAVETYMARHPQF